MARVQSVAAVMAAHAAGNALLLRATLFPLLREDSLTMAHLDPTEIVAAPLPMHELCTFVGSSLLWCMLIACGMMLLADNPQSRHNRQRLGALHAPLITLASTIITHFIFILCGIHPTMLPLHTLVAAFFVAFNLLLPVILFAPLSNASEHQYSGLRHSNSIIGCTLSKVDAISKYLFGPARLSNEESKDHTTYRPDNKEQFAREFIQWTTLGTLAGMAACSILRVLDHGMQIQRYPIPIVLGYISGQCGGVFVAALIVGYRHLVS